MQYVCETLPIILTMFSVSVKKEKKKKNILNKVKLLL